MVEEFVSEEPAEETAEAPEEEVDRKGFRCENCGAEAIWDPDADALSCEYCGHQQAIPRGEGTILERSLLEAGTAARGLGLAVRVAQCENCGARVSFDAAATSSSCVFCGSSNVMAQEENRNAIRPESLVPMDVGRGAVEENFRRWTKGKWFRPNALRNVQAAHAVGVYVPHWTFDCRVRSEWSADSGTYYYVNVRRRVAVGGRTRMQTRRERRVRWRPAWGDRRDAYDDLLVNASRAVSDALARKLGGFDTSQLVPYRPEYLAGWHAEEYQLDLERGWDTARDLVTESQRSRCATDVPGDTHRNLQVRNTLSDVTWKHVLLPIWTLNYELGGKRYPVLINGQTGRVKGEAPLSWVKILLLVLVLGFGLLLVLAIGGLSGPL